MDINDLLRIKDGVLEKFDPYFDFVLPDTVTAISDAAFRDCYPLVGIEFPRTLQSIGDEAFYGCSIDILEIAKTL